MCVPNETGPILMCGNFDFFSEFIALLEARDYPIWGSQFHPEKNSYEWSRKYKNIPHTKEAMEATIFFANYFVEQTRRNFHEFESRELEEQYLIYNFSPEFTGREEIDYVMQQCYFF